MKRLSFANQIAALWGLVAAICAVLVAAVWLTANVGEGSHLLGTQLGPKRNGRKW